MIRRTIHRADLNGRPQCGAAGAVSTSGVAGAITCQYCRDMDKGPDAAAAMAEVRAAADRFRREDR